MTETEPAETKQLEQRPLAEPGLPLTPERIASIQDISDVQISPDGSRVAFVVQDASKAGEHPETAIWLVPYDGDALDQARQFTSGLWNDHTPRWSPDGSRLAFLSDRAERGKMSVYVMPADGGEALRVFDQQGDMSELSWSPDGRWLAVLFTDPETEEEKKRKEERDDAVVWDHDQKYRRLWVIDPDTQSASCVSPAARQVRGYAWAPDAERLAVDTTPNTRIDEVFGENEVALISRSGGDPAPILTLVGQAENLTWSSDGERIAFRARGDKVVHPEVVFTLPASGGEPVNITPDYWGTAERILSIDGGASLLMLGSEGVNLVPHRLGWDGELAPLVTGEQRGWAEGGFSVSRDGTRLAGAWQGPLNPPNVTVLATRDGGGDGCLRRRTDFNADLRAAALGETVVVRWESDPGVEVEGLLVKPHGYQPGARYPLIVQVHGGPTWAWPNMFYASWHDWAQMLAGRGYAVLMPNPRGSTGRGVGYNNQIFNDVGGGELRDMLSGVDALIARGIADPDRLGIGGWSWGGYMTAWAVSQTTRFKAAVMGAGLSNMVSDNGIGDIPSANLSYFDQSPYDDPEPYWQRSAIRYVRNVTTPTLVLHGEVDKRVNMAQGQEMYVALRTLGVETRFVTYPREEHGIKERKHQIDLMRRVIEWYDTYVMRDAGRGMRDA
jgi:dipeptidyl aminopeptidase/acylaminoacyl peptidase